MNVEAAPTQNLVLYPGRVEREATVITRSLRTHKRIPDILNPRWLLIDAVGALCHHF